MHSITTTIASGSEGQSAPPIKGACAPGRKAVRLHRTRGKNRFTPAGAIYVGRPTDWCNPFERRNRIGHKRSTILFTHWLSGDLDRHILALCRFSPAEILTLERRRLQLLAAIPNLAGRNLQCWCPLTSPWCHADILLALANGDLQ